MIKLIKPSTLHLISLTAGVLRLNLDCQLVSTHFNTPDMGNKVHPQLILYRCPERLVINLEVKVTPATIIDPILESKCPSNTAILPELTERKRFNITHSKCLF
jgi:hypothetical protein